MSVALAVIPKPLCVLSFLCSFVVIREVLHSVDQSKRNRTLRNCLLNIAIADCIGSAALFFTTWPMPSYVPGYFQNVGTETTCTVQGFFIEIGYMAGPLFSLNLSILFVLLVRYNAAESKLFNYQYWSQNVIWVFTIAFAVMCLCLGFYNPVQGFCWVAPYPFDCLIREDGVCLRGENAQMAVLTHVGLAFTTPLCGQIFMFGWLFRTVYEIEDPMNRSTHHSALRFSSSGQGNNAPETVVNRSRSKAVAVRSLLYIGGYLLTFFLSFIELILLYFHDSDALATPATSLLATQGIWVLMVFMKNRAMFTPEGKFIKHKLCSCLYKDEAKLQQSGRGSTHRSGSKPSADSNKRPSADGSFAIDLHDTEDMQESGHRPHTDTGARPDIDSDMESVPPHDDAEPLETTSG